MRRVMTLASAAGLCLFLGAGVLSAQTTLTPQISGNTLTAKIELPGGIAADLTIVFEQAVGLNANALTLSVGLVNPTDPSLLSRLPDPKSISIPPGFPVLVHIDPTAGSSLSFSGVYTLSLHTHNLTLVTNSPLRLFRAPSGGSFQDMAGFLEVGSVRAGGSGPGFSDFLLVADTRLVDGVIAGKFDALQGVLTANSASINPAVSTELQQRLTQARNLYSSGTLTAAIDAVASFSRYVKQESGANIPDVWRAGGGPVNVAGLLRSGADTLKFSLTAKSNGTP
jgi:uncharacterized protein DUF6689